MINITQVNVLVSKDLIWSRERNITYLTSILIISALPWWPAKNDERNNIHLLTCVKRQPHLQPAPVLGGHRRSPLSCHRNRRHGGKFSRAVNSDATLRLRQSRLSCTSGVKAGVRSCCLFNFLTSHKSGLSTPLFFRTLSFCFSLLHKNPFSHVPLSTFAHTYFLCLHHSPQ